MLYFLSYLIIYKIIDKHTPVCIYTLICSIFYPVYLIIYKMIYKHTPVCIYTLIYMLYFLSYLTIYKMIYKHTPVCRYTHMLCCLPCLSYNLQNDLQTYTCLYTPICSIVYPVYLHLFVYRGFPTRMVYLYYISCLRYTILVGNPRYTPICSIVYSVYFIIYKIIYKHTPTKHLRTGVHYLFHRSGSIGTPHCCSVVHSAHSLLV